MISSVYRLAHYGVSRAKDWVSVNCGTTNDRAGPRTLEYGGHRMSMYGICGVSRMGGEYERGLPCHIGGPGGSPPGKNLGNCGAGKTFFKPVLGQNFRFQT